MGLDPGERFTALLEMEHGDIQRTIISARRGGRPADRADVPQQRGLAALHDLDSNDPAASRFPGLEGVADDVRRAHAEYYAGVVDALAPRMVGADEREATLTFLADLDNVRAAVEWAVVIGDTGLALRLVAQVNASVPGESGQGLGDRGGEERLARRD